MKVYEIIDAKLTTQERVLLLRIGSGGLSYMEMVRAFVTIANKLTEDEVLLIHRIKYPPPLAKPKQEIQQYEQEVQQYLENEQRIQQYLENAKITAPDSSDHLHWKAEILAQLLPVELRPAFRVSQ